jgi:hypothetical protein
MQLATASLSVFDLTSFVAPLVCAHPLCPHTSSLMFSPPPLMQSEPPKSQHTSLLFTHAHQAEALAAAAKVRLPADMVETARTVGIRSTALSKYISLQVSHRDRPAQCPLGLGGEALNRSVLVAGKGFITLVWLLAQ